jgi:hypothetical protein
MKHRMVNVDIDLVVDSCTFSSQEVRLKFSSAILSSGKRSIRALPIFYVTILVEGLMRL